MIEQDGSMDAAFEKKLRDWLDTSGQTLELRTARTLRQAGAIVELSKTYDDVRTGQPRESDVIAAFAWTGRENIHCSITMVVECKSSAKHPWVGFYQGRRDRMSRSLSAYFTFDGAPMVGVLDHLIELWGGEPPLNAAETATHVVAGFTEPNRHDPVHDALRQVLSAANAVQEDYLRKQTQRREGLLVMPVIVAEAPLVRAGLDDKGNMQISGVDTLQVWAVNSITGVRQRVFVLHETALQQFADDISQLARLAHQRA